MKTNLKILKEEGEKILKNQLKNQDFLVIKSFILLTLCILEMFIFKSYLVILNAINIVIIICVLFPKKFYTGLDLPKFDDYLKKENLTNYIIGCYITSYEFNLKNVKLNANLFKISIILFIINNLIFLFI